MSDIYAPFTPTPGGAVVAARIGSTYRWVYIKNSSNYDLLYSLAAEQPTSTTNYPQWDGRIEPGHGAILTIPSQHAQEAMSYQALIHGPFAGTIWLALINYSAMLALTGTASGANNVWVTGYFEREGYPQIDASNANGSQYQQQRVISLYPSLTPFISTFTITAAGQQAAISLVPGGGVAGYLISAQNFANNLVTAYLYGGFLYAGNTASNAQIQLTAFAADASNSALGTGALLWQGQVWSGGVTPRTHDIVPLAQGPVVPSAAVSLSGLPTAVSIIMVIKCVSVAGTTPYPIDHSIIWGIDTANINPPVPNGYRLAIETAGGANGPY